MTTKAKIKPFVFVLIVFLSSFHSHAQIDMDEDAFATLARYHINLLEQTSFYWIRLRHRPGYDEFKQSLFGYFIGCYGDFENTYSLTIDDAIYRGDLMKLNAALAFSFPGEIAGIPLRHNVMLSVSDMILQLEDDASWNLGAGMVMYETDVRWIRLQLACLFDLELTYDQEGNSNPFSRASFSTFYCNFSFLKFDFHSLYDFVNSRFDLFIVEYLINLGESRIRPFMNYVDYSETIHLGIASSIENLFDGAFDLMPELSGDLTHVKIDRASLMVSINIDPLVRLFSNPYVNGFIFRLGGSYLSEWMGIHDLFGWSVETGIEQYKDSMGPIYFILGYGKNDYHSLHQFNVTETGLLYLELGIGL
ncbi:MAG: hypothetical protein JXJ04_15330 [Spirochaetales bacterium]|nr:hypothetical protein [Spirochaetales bacterium]